MLGDEVIPCGKPFYAHPKHDVFDDTVFDKLFLAPNGERDVVWVTSQDEDAFLCFDRSNGGLLKGKLSGRELEEDENRFHLNWGKLDIQEEPRWRYECETSSAMAVCSDAVIVAKRSEIMALDLDRGTVLWSHPVPSPAVPWGLAIDRDGRVIATLQDGSVVCFR